MVAKKGKSSGKKAKSLAVKSMSAKKAKGVRGGSLSVSKIATTTQGHEKWIEFSPRFDKY